MCSFVVYKLEKVPKVPEASSPKTLAVVGSVLFAAVALFAGLYFADYIQMPALAFGGLAGLYGLTAGGMCVESAIKACKIKSSIEEVNRLIEEEDKMSIWQWYLGSEEKPKIRKALIRLQIDRIEQCYEKMLNAKTIEETGSLKKQIIEMFDFLPYISVEDVENGFEIKINPDEINGYLNSRIEEENKKKENLPARERSDFCYNDATKSEVKKNEKKNIDKKNEDVCPRLQVINKVAKLQDIKKVIFEVFSANQKEITVNLGTITAKHATETADPVTEVGKRLE